MDNSLVAKCLPKCVCMLDTKSMKKYPFLHVFGINRAYTSIEKTPFFNGFGIERAYTFW